MSWVDVVVGILILIIAKILIGNKKEGGEEEDE